MGKLRGMFREVKVQDLFWDGNPETLSKEQLATLKKYLERLALNGDQEAIEREEREIRAQVEKEMAHLSRSGVHLLNGYGQTSRSLCFVRLSWLPRMACPNTTGEQAFIVPELRQRFAMFRSLSSPFRDGRCGATSILPSGLSAPLQTFCGPRSRRSAPMHPAAGVLSGLDATHRRCLANPALPGLRTAPRCLRWIPGGIAMQQAVSVADRSQVTDPPTLRRTEPPAR
jgi:hypothetical protein